jgi:hypothetical protein
MSTVSRFLNAAVLTAGVMLSIAPAAVAVPPPDPDPAPAPAPAPPTGGSTAACAGGEVVQDGNCVPAMSAVPNTAGGGAEESVPLRINDTESSTMTSGIGTDLVPNINGAPCTGYWSSMACDAQSQADLPAVQPHSTLSTSP